MMRKVKELLIIISTGIIYAVAGLVAAMMVVFQLSFYALPVFFILYLLGVLP